MYLEWRLLRAGICFCIILIVIKPLSTYVPETSYCVLSQMNISQSVCWRRRVNFLSEHVICLMHWNLCFPLQCLSPHISKDKLSDLKEPHVQSNSPAPFMLFTFMPTLIVQFDNMNLSSNILKLNLWMKPKLKVSTRPISAWHQIPIPMHGSNLLAKPLPPRE